MRAACKEDRARLDTALQACDTRRMTTRIVQLTPEQRAKLDEETIELEAEVVRDVVRKAGVVGFMQGVMDKMVAGARRVRAAMTPDNMRAAMYASKRYAALAAKYGVDVARDSVERRIKSGIADTIEGVVSGKNGKRANK